MLSSVEFKIPQELAQRLRPLEDRVVEILELGLREWCAANQGGYEGEAEVLEFLASLPTPQETIDLRPSEALQGRISALLAKNREEGLTVEEEREWELYQYLEHLVRVAKAKAYLRLKRS